MNPRFLIFFWALLFGVTTVKSCSHEGGWCTSDSHCCVGECVYGTCHCLENGRYCVLNRSCCSGVCDRFVCKNCKVNKEYCLKDSDCCSNYCWWFKCH